MPRKANHQGTITFIEGKAKPWRVRLMRDGNTHTKSFLTKEEAERYRNKIAVRDIQVITNVAASNPFETYTEEWLKTKKASMKPRSYDTLESNCRKHVFNYIGKIPIGQIENGDLEKMIQELVKEKLSRSVVDKCKNVVTAVLRRAAAENAIDRYPVFDVNPPSEEVYPSLRRKKMQWFEKPQMDAYIEECYRLYSNGKPKHRNGPMYALLLHTGIRQGEGLALEWPDYSNTAYKLKISKNLVVIKNRSGEGNKFILKQQYSPKTKAGNREIMFTKDAVNDMIALTTLNGNNQYIFANQKGQFINPSSFLEGHKRICRAAGLPEIPLHGLRHSYVTYKYNKGIEGISQGKPFDPRTLAAEIGHASLRTMYDIYTHLSQDLTPNTPRDYDTLEEF